MRRKLPAVILNDKRLVERRKLHLIARWQAQYLATQISHIDAHPIRWALRLQHDLIVLEVHGVLAGRSNGDLIARADLVRRDIGLATVDHKMTVDDKLSSLGASDCETHAEDCVVQPTLEDLQQVVARYSAATDCF